MGIRTGKAYSNPPNKKHLPLREAFFKKRATGFEPANVSLEG
jgi:hypothetical protein